MPPYDPFDLDRRFNQLGRVLESRAATPRWSLLRVVEGLPGPPLSGAEGYLLLLAEPLAAVAGDFDPVGTSPERLAAAARRMRCWGEAVPTLREVPAWETAQQALLDGAARLCAYGGAPARAVQYLAGGASPDPPSLIPLSALEPGTGPRRALDVFLREATMPGPVQERLQQFRTDLQRRHPGVAVPVIERSAPNQTQLLGQTALPRRSPVGGLLRLRVRQVRGDGPGESVGGGRDGQAEIIGPEGASPATRRRLAAAAVEAARPSGGAKQARPRPLRVDVERTPAALPLSGPSYELALAALVLTRVAGAARPRTRFRMASGVVMTGGLKAGGTVGPVAPETLTAKVRAAFFSPQAVFAVPRGQEPEAEAVVSALQERYPRGRLDVIGVRALAEVLDRRRLTCQDTVGRARHAARQVRRRAGPWAIGLALAVLVVATAAALWWEHPLDRIPTNADYAGSTLTLENRYGQIVDQVEVGAKLVRHVKGGNRVSAHTTLRLEADGPPLLAYGSVREDGVEELRLKAVGADSVRWTLPMQFEVRFPEKPYAGTPTYSVEDVFAADTRKGPADELYLLASHSPYFPGLLIEVDPRTGRPVARYVHPGQLTARLRTADLRGDGTPELITGGYNNAFESPVVLALPADRLQGHGPATPAYTPTGLRPAAHHAYVRLPASPVQQANPKTSRFVRGTLVRSPLATGRAGARGPDTPRLQVHVEDGRTGDGLVSEARLYLTFDAGFQLRTVGSSSEYDRLAERLVREGRLEAVPGPDVFRAYRGGVRYWTGSGWQTAPFAGGAGRDSPGT